MYTPERRLPHHSACFLSSANSWSRRSAFSCFFSSFRDLEETFLANSLCLRSFSLWVRKKAQWVNEGARWGPKYRAFRAVHAFTQWPQHRAGWMTTLSVEAGSAVARHLADTCRAYIST